MIAAPPRDLGLDIARIIGALGVVMVHATSNNIPVIEHLDLTWWNVNFLASLARYGVPLFIMISGALLLGEPQESYTSGTMRRDSRLLRLYITGSAITAFRIYSYFQLDYDRSRFLRSIISGETGPHLYFFFILFGLYLFLPIFKGVHKFSNQGILLLVVALIAVENIHYYLSYVYSTSLGILITPNFASYIAYFFLGYYLYHRAPARQAWPHVALILVGGLFTTIAVYLVVLSAGVWRGYFHNYTILNVVLVTVGVFNLCILAGKYLNRALISLPWFRVVIHGVAACALGVYLLHLLLMPFVLRYSPFENLGLTLIFTTVVDFALCVAITYVLRLAPPLRNWI